MVLTAARPRHAGGAAQPLRVGPTTLQLTSEMRPPPSGDRHHDW